jgi:sRNA-binding regulator protein Hfq
MPRESAKEAMKDSEEPRRSATWDEMGGNRKLIRPSLTDMNKEPANSGPGRDRDSGRNEGRNDGRDSNASRQARKRPVPSESTNAESFYYVKQMQAKTPMVIVLSDGEILHGVIEWYDRTCIKVHRTGEPNLLLYKSSIKYLYKENEGD